MKRLMALVGVVLVLSSAFATHAAKTVRVGVLQTGTVATHGHLTRAFATALAELGYVEGKDLFLEMRYADGKLDRLPALAQELTQAKVDVLFAPSALASGAARKIGFSAPIVFAVAPDPLGEGFAASLARPGGNMTGLTNQSPELTAKRLDILNEALPKFSRVAVLYASGFPGVATELAATERAAAALGKALLKVEAKRAEDFEAAFAEAAKWQADALLVIENPMFFVNGKTLVGLAQRHRLPAMYRSKEYVVSGGLMSYGPDYGDLYGRAAGYVDRILRGARAGDLPIERPVKYELVINQAAANALAFKVPEALRMRVDQVVE
jgi:putative ABC transport system substrate-binding protein